MGHEDPPARGLRVHVVASSLFVAHALVAWVEVHGMVGCVEPDDRVDVALADLRDLPAAFRPDDGVPTLALLGDHVEPALVLLWGFRGYLRPDDDPELVPRALATIHHGDVWAERSVLQRLSLEPRVSEPTLRERQVLHLLAKGHSNQRIADELGITVSTVKAHVTSLLEKHGVRSRLELAAHYYAAT